jgi:hypothetical protein
MERDRKIKTYSRHHGSRVVTVDKVLWQSSEEQQKHVVNGCQVMAKAHIAFGK